MGNFKLTDKYGNVFDTGDGYCPGRSYVLIAGGWWPISNDKLDDPIADINAPRKLSHKSGLNLMRLSYHCWGYDYMWRDKAGKWHIAYPITVGHKDCKMNGTKASVPILDAGGWIIAWADVDCKCPCHYNWDPKFATTFNDKMAKDDVDDADAVNVMI